MSNNLVAEAPGNVYGGWTVLSFSHMGKHGQAYWLCRCACGKERPVIGTSLREGRSLSCSPGFPSCVEKMRREEIAKQGMQYCTCCEQDLPIGEFYRSKSDKNRIYGKCIICVTVKSAVRRCVANENYCNHGIKVWGPWATDKKAFSLWIRKNLGSRPEKMSLDRIRNGDGYEPGNLRWANSVEQNFNRRAQGIEAEELRTLRSLTFNQNVELRALKDRNARLEKMIYAD